MVKKTLILFLGILSFSSFAVSVDIVNLETRVRHAWAALNNGQDLGVFEKGSCKRTSNPVLLECKLFFLPQSDDDRYIYTYKYEMSLMISYLDDIAGERIFSLSQKTIPLL